MDIFDIENRYKFHVYNGSNKEVCTINYKVGIGVEEASIDIKDADDLPLEIWLGDKSTHALLIFLKDRVLPANRMFLAEQLKPLGIDPNDWLAKIKLNNGMTYTDDYVVITEEIEDAK